MIGLKTSKINTIIFDLGGVLLNINPLLSLLEFEKISGIPKEELINRLRVDKIFEKFDTGSLNSAQFRSELCRIMNKKASDVDIDKAWNKLLLDFPDSRVKLLLDLRKNYRIFLLSNTNIIHFEKYTSDFYNNFGIPMTDLFETTFLSFEIGMHKPDAGIYQQLIQKANIEPSESIFFDDTLANIEATLLMGIKGIQITSECDVEHFFDNGLLKLNSGLTD